MATPIDQRQDNNAGVPVESEPVFLGGDLDEFPAGIEPKVKPDTEADEAPATDPEETSDTDAFEWPDGVEVPAELKGKSIADVVGAYRNLNTLRGQLASELGESRQLIRDAVAANLIGSKNREPVKDELADLDPEEREVQQRINAAVERALEPIKGDLDKRQLAQAVTTFEMRYPSFQDTVQSPEFKAWVTGSKYRIGMYNRANAYDFEAAEELLGEYATMQKSKAAAADTEVVAIVRQKATVTGGAGGKASSKKGSVYRAIDIQRLYIKDRDQYIARQDEFKKAFEEGRVK